MEWGLWGLFLAWCAALCWCDVRTHRLPNILTVPGVLIAVTVACWCALSGSWSALAGAGIWTAVNALLFVLRSMGAGDVKLAPTLGVAVGIHGGALAVLLAIVVAAGLTAVGAVFARRPAVPHGPSMCIAAFIALAINPS